MVDVPQKAKAAVLVEFGKPLEIREVPIPELEPRAILVKIQMAGICGSDIHEWHGRGGFLAQLPTIMGHETVGHIVKLGEGRDKDCAGELLKIGDRILWAHADCGYCYWCLLEHEPTLCANRRYYGVTSCESYPYLTGGFAEYSYVLPKSEVVKVPDEVTTEEVVGVGCAFRSVVHAYERLGCLKPQDNVVIQGAGPIGLYSLLFARENGAGRIIVIGAPKERLELAKRWGADHVINLDETIDPSDRLKKVQELTRGMGPDVVVEATGVPDAFNQGLEMIRRGGRYLIIGQTSTSTIPIMPAMILFKQIDIVGSLSADISHYYTAIQFIRNNRHKYPLADIITNKYSLEQVNEALHAMESGTVTKPVIVP
ncbi:zinc-binding dehydrogenase [Chloroflexota bacterium]